MKVIAAYLLAVLGGNTSPTADDVKSILESVGAEADEEKLEFLLTELKDKDITEVIAAGRERLSSVPSGGGAIDMGAPAAVAGGGAAPAEEAKKEEKNLRIRKSNFGQKTGIENFGTKLKSLTTYEEGDTTLEGQDMGFSLFD
ncbi:acidic ribosomal protein P2b (rpp2b) [Zea mays]|nr:acidic ribosomal protein P2b (rpp2b) [Zea mays]